MAKMVTVDPPRSLKAFAWVFGPLQDVEIQKAARIPSLVVTLEIPSSAFASSLTSYYSPEADLNILENRLGFARKLLHLKTQVCTLQLNWVSVLQCAHVCFVQSLDIPERF